MPLKTWEYDPAKWPPRFGRLWLWTMGSERANQDRVIRIAQEIGATDVIVLANNPPSQQPTFGVAPNREMTIELAAKVRAAGLGYHIGTWLDTKAAYVNDAAAQLADLARETKATSICIDAEGEWRKRIKNHTQFVAEVVHPAFAGFPCPIGVTSFGGLPNEVVPLLAWAVEHHDGYGMPQAYAVDTGAAWQTGATVQPDTIGGLAWRSWSKITDRLVIIVAAYGKTQAGWTIARALEAQLARAEYEGFPEASVWVEESLVGSGTTAKTRREVLSELDITGKSTVMGGDSIVKPLLIGSGIVAGGAVTRKLWLPALKRAWRFFRGG